jgi:hypothetical protein
MVGSANQGRDSIEELVQEEELSDLADFSYREGLGDREIIYEEDSTTSWLSAEYTIDLWDRL